MTPEENYALYHADRMAWLARRLPEITEYLMSSAQAVNHCWSVFPPEMKAVVWRSLTREQRQFVLAARNSLLEDETCALPYCG